MATQIKRRRGTTSQHSSFTGADAELTVDSDKNTVVVHDDETAGGHPLAKEDWLSVEPHIIPGVLYPSSGNDLAGDALVDSTEGPNSSTVASSKYGTVQASDGRMYYYTDIKGSKPIKDPRIGAHFGSQRYQTSSLQLLEQETATQGHNVYSVDGREWMRAYVTDLNYSNNGHQLRFQDPTHFIEIVGYFNGANFRNEVEANYLGSNPRAFEVKVDGVVAHSARQTAATVGSPIAGRYVDSGSVQNIDLTSASSLSSDTTLGIHTLKLKQAGSAGTNNISLMGIELIAQDTSNVNNIQIPSQNVVSYGKKFTVAGTPHYNPFATKGDGSASTIPDNTTGDSVATGWAGSTSAYWESTLDTATSLGLTAWVEGGAYYRPVNGGRIIKWVDSTGTIKTSVNMMPPSAKAIGSHSGDATPTGATNWSTQYLPIFSTGAIDHSQAEVAKTFHFREFGNGSANGNASYPDFSTFSSTLGADVAYVMDDGLTSLSGDDQRITAEAGENLYGADDDDATYLTFIGTGITTTSEVYGAGTYNIAQNLPYGTHIIKQKRESSGTSSNPDITIDGVLLTDVAIGTYGMLAEITFHQPKRPPIPEDAVVLADYMLMADFVSQPTTLVDASVSKGVRAVSGSRDVFCDDTGDRAFYSDATDSVFLGTNFYMGMATFYSHASTDTSSAQLPFFGTNALIHLQGSNADHIVDFGGSTDVATTALDYGASSVKDIISIDSSATLGINTVKTTVKSSGYSFQGIDVVTPIHTSSHYQAFETPFLHELVGGDRNMEQNNLIVTPDGKTWDEVTRDTSYIGNVVLQTNNTAATSWSTVAIMDEWRGADNAKAYFNKDFAIAYDRMICLVAGWYELFAYGGKSDSTTGHLEISINGDEENTLFLADSGSPMLALSTNYLKRGDYVQVKGEFGIEEQTRYSNVYFKRLGK